MSDQKPTVGSIIQGKLKERGWTQDDLARIIDRYRPEVSNLISGKRGISPELAVALAAAFDMDPEYLLSLETERQLSMTKQNPDEVRRRARLYELAPIKEMEQRGWIPKGLEFVALENALCRFFGVTNLDDEPNLSVATRRSAQTPKLTPSQRAWCARAKQLAESLAIRGRFDPTKLGKAEQELRRLAAYQKEAGRVAETLDRYGIRFVVVEPLRSAKIDGAAFWLSDTQPCIAVSLRWDRIDAFWFTVLHEFAHICAGDALSVDDDLAGEDCVPSSMKNDIERNADLHAERALIQGGELESFIKRVGPLYSKARIIQFAHRVKIHPGIIVGQLQHRGEIGYSSNREMLARVRSIVTDTSLTDGYGNTLPDSDALELSSEN